MAEPIEMSFGLLTQVGPRKHALGEVHTVTWTNRQILLKCPYAVVMRPVVKLLWPLVNTLVNMYWLQ